MKLFGLNIQKREAAEQAPQEQTPQTATGANYTTDAVTISGEGQALSVSAWYRGLAVKADTFAQLVLEYQRMKGKSYELNMKPEGKTINYLIQVQPNPLMTATQFFRQAAIQREVYGNAVIYVERDYTGRISALWLCTNAALNLVTMEYNIVYNRPGGPVSKVVDAEEVIHWRNTFTYDNGLTGVGTLVYAAQTLSIAATNDKQAMDIAAKGGKYKILLQEEHRPEFALNLLTKEQRESQRNDLQNALNNGDDVIALSNLSQPTIISQSSDQLRVLDNRKFDTNTIARFLGVPLVLLMDYSNNTYRAPEQAMQAFLQHTIAPMANDVEAEFNAKLIGPRAYPQLRYHFNENQLMSLDPKGKMEIAKLQLETGIRSVNELREQNNLPGIGTYGDRYLVSTNLQPLDDLKIGKNQTVVNAPAEAKTDNENEEGGDV